MKMNSKLCFMMLLACIIQSIQVEGLKTKEQQKIQNTLQKLQGLLKNIVKFTKISKDLKVVLNNLKGANPKTSQACTLKSRIKYAANGSVSDSDLMLNMDTWFHVSGRDIHFNRTYYACPGTKPITDELWAPCEPDNISGMETCLGLDVIVPEPDALKKDSINSTTERIPVSSYVTAASTSPEKSPVDAAVRNHLYC
ncbi:hypothetical protein B566_EDAN007777 [Ephemera danica]|nr:hypothetical protein B566_EDAN007777 [Ephemera danica]